MSGKYTGAKEISVSTGTCLALTGPNPSWDEFVDNADAEDAGIKANDPKYADLPPADFRAMAASTPRIRELFDEIPPGGVEKFSGSMCNYLSDILRDNPNDPEMAKELIRLQLKQPYFGLFAGLANCMSLLSGGGGMDGLQPNSPPAHRSARENLCP